MTTYYPDHVPKDQERFDRMSQVFRQCATVDEFRKWIFLYTMDASYDRQDLLVALGRVEREKGWHL